MNILCPICNDIVNQAENIIVTKCGHIFHHHCLSRWIERSTTCPQCRNKVTSKCMFRLYPTLSTDSTGGMDVVTLQSKLDDVQFQLRQEKTAAKEKDDQLNDLQSQIKKYMEQIEKQDNKLVSTISGMKALKEQVEYLKIQNKETVKLKEENEALNKHLQLLNGLNEVFNATYDDVEKMLEDYSGNMRTVALFATSLKRALCESETKKRELRDKLHAAKQQIAADKNTIIDLQAKLNYMENKLIDVENKYSSLVKRKTAEIDRVEIESGSMIVDKEQPSKKHMRPSLDENKHNDSVGTLVQKIENSDSPYLSLKQSNLALSTLLKNGNYSIPVDKIKPSEFAIINLERNKMTRPLANENLLNSQNSKSIFSSKEPIRLDAERENKCSPSNINYDGLGGHSKLDPFPVPSKSFIPKLSSKHRLKKPPTTKGNQDVSKMLQKLLDK